MYQQNPPDTDTCFSIRNHLIKAPVFTDNLTFKHSVLYQKDITTFELEKKGIKQ